MIWIADVAMRYAIIVLSIGLAVSWWSAILAVFVVGVMQHAILIRGHEAAHWHVTRWRRGNDILAAFCFWPFLVSVSAYRRIHFAHHAHTGDRIDDPEIRHKRMTPSRWRPEASRAWLFVSDLLGGAVRDVILVQWFLRPTNWREVVGPACVAALAVYFLPWQAIVIWFAALYTSMWAVSRQRAYTEHVGTDGTHRMSRPALWRRLFYLPCNTWLHWEHHQRPSVPYRWLRA